MSYPPMVTNTRPQNEYNKDHAINCPCAFCKVDPFRKQASDEAMEAQRRQDSADVHAPVFRDMPDPTEADFADPLFDAIWETIKRWDVNVPESYVGYCGANGSHVMLILNAVRAASNGP